MIKKFSRRDLDVLFADPIMGNLVLALKEIAKTEAEHYTRTINLNRSCEQIALQSAEFKGRQACLNVLSDVEALEAFLFDYMTEETKVEVENIG